jgi:vacuolar-type H+-ATPase subunit B/Vma2
MTALETHLRMMHECLIELRREAESAMAAARTREDWSQVNEQLAAVSHSVANLRQCALVGTEGFTRTHPTHPVTEGINPNH